MIDILAAQLNVKDVKLLRDVCEDGEFLDWSERGWLDPALAHTTRLEKLVRLNLIERQDRGWLRVAFLYRITDLGLNLLQNYACHWCNRPITFQPFGFEGDDRVFCSNYCVNEQYLDDVASYYDP